MADGGWCWLLVTVSPTGMLLFLIHEPSASWILFGVSAYGSVEAGLRESRQELEGLLGHKLGILTVTLLLSLV